ncbi:electron transfer flavoprotein alpha subunit [Desulfocicer vacuolatum DSM 3385]|uniref:Electron transfer flavoprotein alpha subunit n=1 Tax=Desulfocicer vacuolatum DSM 3385 TaxID=1121400 RepID=A0A1W2CAP7_9BACT|nr:electron transfer flavoprotein subunit alpha/FixB family protein [Desulfocicer vacuolatum]SMC82273.1 electron transfer flavoprotein alpha subunit [Desulfocicer vacuolatum DSM 3385]
MEKTGVVIEIKKGRIKDANLGMIACARAANREVYALILNDTAENFREILEAHGVHAMVEITTGGADHTPWNPEQHTRAIITAMEALHIKALLALTTPMGRELLPRIAAALDAPLVMDCIDVDLEKGLARTTLYSGKTIGTIQVTGSHELFGIRPNVIAPVPVKTKAKMISMPIDTPVSGKFKTVEILPGQSSQTDITEADIIISGGRAMQSKENFDLLFQCAHTMGAAVGASRVAVDMGWVPYTMQVGQTGEKVSPRVYIACGISGSIQHFAGMKMSGMIIAINTNAEAAMVSNCDYFIEGDLFEIVPLLTQRLTQKAK